jgi:predicted  nucleic acid-binding Zn-ribbon protein
MIKPSVLIRRLIKRSGEEGDKIDALDARVNALDDKVDELDERVDILETQVEMNVEAIANHEARITELEPPIEYGSSVLAGSGGLSAAGTVLP